MILLLSVDLPRPVRAMISTDGFEIRLPKNQFT